MVMSLIWDVLEMPDLIVIDRSCDRVTSLASV
jgi:hypothetical protein